jgi:cytidylate kinase
VFLTATPEVRAERRYKQLMAKGLPAKIQHLLRDLKERDARDAARSVAPLRHSADAALLETSGMTIVEAVDAVLAMARARGVSY